MKAGHIRALRKRLRLSPEDFAAALGFPGCHARITVWRWETGKRKPSAQTIALMKLLARGISNL
jgi:DNA-binding transcriptional regulator YiaG